MKRLRQRSARALRFEALEPRRLLTNGLMASLSANGILSILGTSGDDQCLFHQTNGFISISGVNGAWQASEVKSINLDLQGGDDFISLASAANGGNQTIANAAQILSGAGATRVRTAGGHDVYMSGLGHKLSIARSGAAQLDGVTLNFSKKPVVSLNSAGILSVTGTDAADTLSFRQKRSKISIDGVRGSWSAAKVTSIVVHLQSGNDIVSLNSIANGGTQTIQENVLIDSGPDDKLIRLADGHNAVLAGYGHRLAVSSTGNAVLDAVAVNWANVVSSPILAAASDSGISSADRITSITTPLFTGKSAAGASVTLLEGATVLGAATADGSGNWSITSSVLASGVHHISAAAVDLVGNATKSWFVSVTIDTTGPTVSLPDLATASDSGRSSGDNITKLSTLTISGVAESSATVTLFDGGLVIGSTTAANGKWSFTAVHLAGGTHNVSARATDLAGNQTTSAALAITVDATLPAIATFNLAPASDSGDSAADHLTRVTTPVFTGATEAGALVTLFERTKTLGTATADSSGNWSVTASALARGSHSITARATDVAGNISALSGAIAITIDASPPIVSKPDLAATSDTGTSSIDNRTSDVTPTFTGTAETGAAITLLEGSTVLGTGIATGGVWSITSVGLSNGVHYISARAADHAGNQSTSAALAVTIDAAPVTVSTPDLIAASDTGSSSSDNITRLTTLTFTGTAKAGATVTLLEGSKDLASAIATAGVWTITASGLSAGVHNVAARASDSFGNQATSAALVVTIDTTPPAVSVPQLVGSPNASNAMSFSTPVFASQNHVNFPSSGANFFLGTADGFRYIFRNRQILLDLPAMRRRPAFELLERRELLTTGPLGDLNRDGSLTSADVPAMLAALTDVDAYQSANALSHDDLLSIADINGDGAFDNADLHSLFGAIRTAELPPPAAPQILNIASATVASNSALTNESTPLLIGTADAGARIDILDGSTVIGSTTADSSGNWSMISTPLIDGTHNIAARATDSAGNQAVSSALLLTIDTVAPSVSNPRISTASDTGASHSDGITSITTPVLVGTAEPGATVQLFEGSSMIGSSIADTAGNWSFASTALSAGAHVIAAKATDLAGNQSAFAAFVLTIDTSAPAVSAPDLTTASDDGSSTTDNITSITAPVFAGTSEAGATIELIDGSTVLGSTTADASGNWSITSSTLAGGAHSILARATDLAGNQSTSAALAVTVDTAGPSVSAPDLAAASDSGSSNSDNVTKLTTLTFTGTAEAGATVELVEGSAVLGSTTASGGAWSITVNGLAGGVHSITARASDSVGNQSTSAALSVTIDTATPAVSTPDLAAASDSGSSNSDNITKLTTLTFTGTAEAGASITLLEGSTVLGSTTATGGAWSITVNGLAGGAHNLTAQAADLAGNQSISGALSITIDTSAPTVSVPDLTTASDDGVSTTDNITSIATPVFTGTAEAGASVQLLEGTTVLGSATADASGNWSITSSTLAGGTHNVAASATDLAGNQATSAALSVTVDASGPSVSAPDLAAASDSGSSNSDNVTSVTTPVFNGTAEAGATITLLEGSTVLGTTTANGAGNWSITSSTLAGGVHNITARATDLAGNQSTSTALSVTIDTADPSVSAPDLAAASDSGSSTSDNTTKLTTLTFTGTAEAGTSVTLLEGSTVLGSTAATGGNWSITVSGLAGGGHNISARATDLAGNQTTSVALAVTIDTVVPVVSAPDLAAAGDSGSSTSDNVTNVATPVFNGTAEAGALVQLLEGSTVLGSTTADASGNWSVTSAALADGAHNITARATDLAGNQLTSAALAVTIDTVVPVVSAPDLAAASDSGNSNADNITGVTTPVFTGTADAGATVQLWEGSTVLGSAIANGSGVWSITSSALADGVHSITARATDAAGNTSALSGALSVTIDTSSLFVSAPDLAAASDSGATSSDNLTNVSAPVFTGTATAGTTVQLLEGATVLGTATADSSGNWSITASGLAGGAHNISARTSDLAGNSSTSAALVVTIDATVPAVSAPDLAAASDSGSSNSDNVTSVTTPVFNGTAEVGATIELLEGSTVLGTATADASGNWSITSSVLAGGVHNITTRAIDLAGNQTTSAALAVTIDTTAPAVSAPDLAAASDSGSSSSDNTTKFTTITMSGTAEAGASVTLLEGSTVLGSTTATGGTWSITVGGLAGGAHNLTARAADLAGNQTTSGALSITIDASAPAVSAPDLAVASDSGSSNSDNVTSVTTPVFTGTAEVGAAIELLEGSTVLGTATADASGNWSITSSVLAGGVHNLTARATDLAGNQSTSAALAVTIDTTAPAVSAPDLAAASDSGSSNSDNVTKLTTLTFTGTAEAGTTVTLLEGSTVLGTATATGGAWSINASGLSAGSHSLTARATDSAGNQTTSAALAVTIDTTAPSVSAPDLAAASDSGSSSSDNTTKFTTLTFNGTAEAGASITLLDGATILGTTTAAGGNWSITASGLAAGTHNISAQAADSAGNQATSGALAVTVYTTAPSVSAPDLSAASDDGASNTDNTTSITTPVFTGTAEAGATVELLEGSTVLGTATADGSGNWSITASALAAGTHSLTARATDVAGNQTTSAALAVTIGGSSPTQNWFDTNIQDATIRTYGSQYYQDGLIDRTDMINLLRQVETTGSIDATEMSDLTLIVNTASLFGSLDYVDNLASKIVLNNAANAHYQGGTLGNLAVGSSAAQLELLVDKWFLGTDHPAAWSGYSVVAGPLFQNGASYTDIAQGGLGDCGLMTAFAEIAYRSPATITSMFIVNGDGTYTVRFYNNGTANYLTIDSQLPSGYASIANELWVGLAEKAWAQFYEVVYGSQNSYSAIAGTFIFDALGKITGQTTTAFTSPSTASLTTFVNAFNAGKMIGFASKSSGTTDGVVANHAYAVIDYDPATQSVTLFNPWGVGIGNGGLITLTWTQIQNNFLYFDRVT